MRYVWILLCLSVPAFAQRPAYDPVRPHAVDPGLSVRSLDFPYETDFEDMTLGSLDGQDNWVADDPFLFEVVSAPAVDARSVRSLGGNQLTNVALQSFGIGNQGGGTIAWDWYFAGFTDGPNGADQQIILQPNINTQPTVLLRIARDYTTRRLRMFVSISETAGIWVDLGFDIPKDRWVPFRIELRADRSFDLYIDDVYIRSAFAFTDKMEEFVIFNDGFTGNWMYVDNISITGDNNCSADLNDDQVIDLSDLSLVLANFGAGAGGDVDGDGDTDLSDLAEVLANFGEVCA